MRGLLANRNGRLYLAGQALSIFGDSALWLAAAIWVKTLTQSNAAAALVFFFFALPSLFSPLAGLVVDRLERRPLLAVTNLVLAGIVLLLLLVHNAGDVWLIYIVMVLYGGSYSLLASGESALLRLMLPAELLGDANGMLQTLRQGLRLVGPLAGAGLFAWRGGDVVAVVDAGTFVVAAMTVIALRVSERRPEPLRQRWLAELTVGIRYAWQTTVLRQLLVAAFIVIVPFAFAQIVFFAVVGTGLHRPPTFLGVLATMQGVGAIAAGITSAALMRRTSPGALTGIGIAIFAVSLIFCIPPWLPTVMVGAVLLGSSVPWTLVGLNTLLQLRTPIELQGRVYAAFDTLVGVPQTVSIAIGAGLIRLLDYRLLLSAMALISMLSALYLLTRREQWQRAEMATSEKPRFAAQATFLLPESLHRTDECIAPSHDDRNLV